jgi:uncharacterized membrane-anchored protein YhcB (DUF1043 family)
MKQYKRELLLKLAEDARMTANREHKYSKMAAYEAKFAKQDLIVAKKKKQIARAADDRTELTICKQFSAYRDSVGDHYQKVARHFRRMAK